VLLDFGLVRSRDDPCLFVALLYVDDIAVTGDWGARVQDLIDHLSDTFAEIKSEALVKFLGMQCIRDRESRVIKVHLNDYAYAVVGDQVPDHIPGSLTPLFATVEYRGLPPGKEEPI
jgi:hypothetical protein